MPESYIELSKSALQNNLQFLRGVVGETRISSVVKSNAYGHGLYEFIQILGECGINHISVFSSREARKVKDYLSFRAEIMIMGWIGDEDLEWVISNNIEFFVFDFQRLENAIAVSKKIKVPAKIHIELETGMNRTGFPKVDLKKLCAILDENRKNFTLKGLCTHLAGAESVANFYRVNDQIRNFNKTYRYFVKKDLKPEIRHAACSAAILAFPKARFEMVRVGIMQYGFWPSKETYIQYISKRNIKYDPLKQILSWKSTVMSLKEVKTGEFVSYGTSYLAQKNMKIAIIPVGYAHGYNRSLSNQGRVLIKGQRVGVVGMVNMNMLIADVSTVENIKMGDEVVLIGTQEDLSINVSSFTEFSNQLNYELLTRLPSETARLIIK